MPHTTTAPLRLHTLAWALFAAIHAAPSAAQATEEHTTINQLKQEIELMRRSYEARLKALEARLDEAQRSAGTPTSTTQLPRPATPGDTAFGEASGGQPEAASMPQEAVASGRTRASHNSFNPAVSLILGGTYASLAKDPATWQLAGFVPGGDETGPGARSFSLRESELGLSANIDPWFYGAITLAISPEDTISAEEAFVQTTALPHGLKVKAGRFLGGLGYLNEHHAHTWDFVDAPLAYQAFSGGPYKQEGLQAKWLLPTDHFIEVGAELGNGHSFPGNDRNRNGAGAMALFAHTGGDMGPSHSWRAGVSWLQAKAKDRSWDTTDALDQDVTNAFTGRSRLWVIDGVWKWAPQGNASRTSFKLQGEYFRRTETGELTYAVADPASLGLSAHTDAYRSAQSGWYLQGVYQFAPGWRVGLRHDRLDSGRIDLASNAANLNATTYNPKRHSVMLDWSPSEFSRWRIQLNDDRAREGIKDQQLFLQYQMSLGAHGAHSY